MEAQTWKVLAIVFIILFIFETVVIVWAWTIGTQSLRNENICANDCGYDPEAGFYLYDDYAETCYCMNGKGDFVREVQLD